MTSASSGIPEADFVARDRKLMLASMFVLSRRTEVPTFAYQLSAFDEIAFPDVSESRKALDALARVGVLEKRTVNRLVMAQLPAKVRGDADGYYLTDAGVRVLRVAYRSYRPQAKTRTS